MSRNKGGNGGGKSKNTNTSADYDKLRREAKDRQQRGRRRIGAPTVSLVQLVIQDRLAELFEAASTEIRTFGDELVERRGQQVTRWSESTTENAMLLLRSYIYSDAQEPEFNFTNIVRQTVQEAFAKAVLDMQDRGVKPPWLPGRGRPWFPHAGHAVRRDQLISS